jgi:hypothetical protein
MSSFVAGLLAGSLVGSLAMAAVAARRSGDIGRTLLGSGTWLIDVDECGDIVCAVQDR